MRLKILNGHLWFVFFDLAGTSFEFNVTKEIGLIAVIYIECRIIGNTVRARIGSQYCNADLATKRWMGIAIFPQEGVAIGRHLKLPTSPLNIARYF